MLNRIGYFVPEFPGQTHIFFWREIAALKEQGVQIDVVSTQRPVAQIMSHTWASEAQRLTTYLFPPTCNLLPTVVELLRCGPAAWWRCLQTTQRSPASSLTERARLLSLMIIGAELSAIARQRQWKHLHVHSCANAANVALFAHLLSGLPYSLTLHGPLSDYGTNQPQKWKYAKFGTVITQKLYEEVQQELAGYLPQQISIAPMGVDLSTFNRKSSYQPWNGESPFRIFSCGRLNVCKGHAVLIEAIAVLQQRGISVELQIAGEDEQGGSGYRRELEALIERRGLHGSVHLMGAVSEEVIRQSLEKANVFALASYQEPLGVAIMEAMAMELPVVVTGEGGVKELVEDGKDGVLVDIDAPDQIADAVIRLMLEPAIAKQMGQSGRRKVQQQFHSRRSAGVLCRAIDENVLDKKAHNQLVNPSILTSGGV